MLVLSRYCDESIYIGDDVVITIVDIRGDRVRLGIQAPPNVSVHRQEVYEAIEREKKAANAPVKSEKTVKPLRDLKPKKPAKPMEDDKPSTTGKALPIDIETPGIGFGGITDIVSQ